jgi:class 3 adenylate cyclase
VTDPTSPKIDELLDRAINALLEGDPKTAHALASEVLKLDSTNLDAEDLIAAPMDFGEIRRLPLMFADLVGSTELSTRTEPEIYRRVVGRYKEIVREAVKQYEGYVCSTKGDGLMILFGHPTPHENDVQRSALAGLQIVREVAALSELVHKRFGFPIAVRVGIHRGIAYLDLEQDDVYGLAANVTARVSGLAPPGAVVVSSALEPLISDHFELMPQPPQAVKGIAEPVACFQVLGEHVATERSFHGHVVGRRREMKYLESSWNQALSSNLTRPGVSLRGEAGIGKSRLARAVIDHAAASGAVVLELHGSPFHTDVGLGPVRALLERSCGITRTSTAAERLHLLSAEIDALSLDATTMIPLLAPVLGIAREAGYDAAPLDGKKLYDHIAAAVDRYLRARIGDKPALVVAEDMHWFDDDTAVVVRTLLTGHAGNVMVVMTGREEATLPAGSDIHAFELRALTDAECDELLASLHPELTDAERAAVRSRGDGIPLFIEEIAAKVSSHPSDAAQSSWVPDTIYEALLAQLRSTQGSRRLVEAAAAIGSRIDRGLLFAVMGLEQNMFDDIIADAELRRLLVPAGDGWRFRHELVREVARELSPPSSRRRLHSRIAEAMAAAASNPDWPVVAGHYARAERYSEAATCFQHASADARRRGSVIEARAHLGSAITQIENAPPGLDRDRLETSLRLQRGFLVYAAEGASSVNAASEFERCLEITGTERSEDLVSTLSALYAFYAMRADLDRVDQLLTIVRRAVDGGREWIRAFNLAGFGMLAWYRGEFDRALDTLVSAATALTDEDSLALAPMWFMPNEGTASIYTHLALARAVHGDLTGAEAELDRTQLRCNETGFPQGPFSLAYAYHLEFLIRVESGQLEAAARAAAGVARIGEEHGFDSWALAGAAQSATAAALIYQSGDDAEPDVLLGHVNTLTMFTDTWRALGVNALITFYDAIAARLLLAANRPAEAHERIESALALADATDMHFHDSELLRLRAQTRSNSDERSADLNASIQLARKQHAAIYELRSAIDLFDSTDAGGRAAVTEAIEQFTDDSTWPLLRSARLLIE